MVGYRLAVWASGFGRPVEPLIWSTHVVCLPVVGTLQIAGHLHHSNLDFLSYLDGHHRPELSLSIYIIYFRSTKSNITPTPSRLYTTKFNFPLHSALVAAHTFRSMYMRMNSQHLKSQYNYHTIAQRDASAKVRHYRGQALPDPNVIANNAALFTES
jgi:hypothetical protein